MFPSGENKRTPQPVLGYYAELHKRKYAAGPPRKLVVEYEQCIDVEVSHSIYRKRARFQKNNTHL